MRGNHRLGRSEGLLARLPDTPGGIGPLLWSMVLLCVVTWLPEVFPLWGWGGGSLHGSGPFDGNGSPFWAHLTVWPDKMLQAHLVYVLPRSRGQPFFREPWLLLRGLRDDIGNWDLPWDEVMDSQDLQSQLYVEVQGLDGWRFFLL